MQAGRGQGVAARTHPNGRICTFRAVVVIQLQRRVPGESCTRGRNSGAGDGLTCVGGRGRSAWKGGGGRGPKAASVDPRRPSGINVPREKQPAAARGWAGGTGRQAARHGSPPAQEAAHLRRRVTSAGARGVGGRARGRRWTAAKAPQGCPMRRRGPARAAPRSLGHTHTRPHAYARAREAPAPGAAGREESSSLRKLGNRPRRPRWLCQSLLGRLCEPASHSPRQRARARQMCCDAATAAGPVNLPSVRNESTHARASVLRARVRWEPSRDARLINEPWRS